MYHPSSQKIMTMIEIETFYGFQFPYFNSITSSYKFALGVFNNEIKTFNVTLDNCIIILYSYL